MVGTTVAHNTLILNLAFWLNPRLSRPCRVLINDVKVYVKTDTENRFYYPDLMMSLDYRTPAQVDWAGRQDRLGQTDFYQPAPILILWDFGLDNGE